MKKFLPALLLLSSFTSFSQTFWTENFGSGCNQGTSANGFNSTNGAWADVSTGTNDNYADEWFVSGTATNTGAGNCAAGCSASSNPSLHIGNAAIPVFSVAGDQQCTYLTGVFCGSYSICSVTHKRMESPTINCSGKSNITISFIYLEGGELADDDARLWFNDGIAGWVEINQLAKTVVCGSSYGIWTSFSMMLPATANNNPNVKIGFNWTNDNDAQGTDPSFAVDDIQLSAPAASTCGVTIQLVQGVACNGDCNGIIAAFSTSGTGPFSFLWNTTPPFTQPTMNNLCAGSYTVIMTDSTGCADTATYVLTQPTALVLNGVTPHNPTTIGGNDGAIDFTVSGGVGPYNITWMPTNGTLGGTGLTGLVAGTYIICAQDSNSCSLCDTVTISDPVGIFSSGLPGGYSLIPNLLSQSSTLMIPADQKGIHQLKIVNAFGELVRENSFTGNYFVIEKGNLPQGIYFLSLENAGSKNIFRTKLMVQ